MKQMTPSPMLEEVSAYSPPRTSSPIDLHLDGNEGSMPPQSLLSMLGSQDSELLRRYPDASELESELASIHKINRERVLVTAGADDALERALRAVLGPKEEVILPVPTFGMIARFAKLAGGEVLEVPWLEGTIPTDEMIAAVTERTAVIVVVTPNSPTGLVARARDLERLSTNAPWALLLVDLAYVEFADRDITSIALSFPNTVVTRTFSKAWGLAGLRVGYAMGNPRVIEWMRATGHPYSVSAPSLLLARERLARDREEVRGFVARVREQREKLSRLIESLGAHALPSQGNFLLGKFDDGDQVCSGLAELGIAVRPFPGKPYLENCLRITVPGDVTAFDRLYAGLTEVLTATRSNQERLP